MPHLNMYMSPCLPPVEGDTKMLHYLQRESLVHWAVVYHQGLISLLEKWFVWVFASLIFLLELSHHNFKSKSKLCYNRRSVSQSVLVSSPIWSQRPDFYYCQTMMGLLTWAPYQSPGTHDDSLLSQVWDSPNMEGQVPVFISPRNRVAQL
jgi:hypothetical protein